jgi:hypothetical protein
MSLRILVLALLVAGCGARPAVSPPDATEVATLARAALPRATTGDALRLVTHWPIEPDSAHADGAIDLSTLLSSIRIEVVPPEGEPVILRPRISADGGGSLPVARSSGMLWVIEEGGLQLATMIDEPAGLRALPWTETPRPLLSRPGRYRVSISGHLPLGDRRLRFASPPVTIELVQPRPAMRPLIEIDERARLAVVTTHSQLDDGHPPVTVSGGPLDVVANPAGNRVLRYHSRDRAGVVRAWQVTMRPDGDAVGLQHVALPGCAAKGGCPPPATWQWDDPWNALYRPITDRPR